MSKVKTEGKVRPHVAQKVAMDSFWRAIVLIMEQKGILNAVIM